ncbi:hypothetical protein DITRI_Ditri20bG0048200 [Diplodiscus trichospermus]
MKSFLNFQVFTVKWIIIFNLGDYSLIMLLTNLLTKGSNRVTVMGWICAVHSVAVFASPLSIMRQVIRTRSVEHMPFFLSFFLSLCGIVWFFYGLFIKDFFIALPNGLGFLLGIAQMTLYVIYKNATKDAEITETQQKGNIELNLSSVEDANPCLANHQPEIKELTTIIAEEPVESGKNNA